MKTKLLAVLRHPISYAAAFWMVGILVVVAIFDFLIMPIVAGHLSFLSPVPAVIGKTPIEAEKLLHEADLNVAWDTIRMFSAKIPEGKVAAQVPPAGREVKEGRTVYLVKSLGIRMLIVPDIQGQSLDQAQVILKRMGFVPGAHTRQAHPILPMGAVIGTLPAAGRQMHPGDTIALVLSSGAEGSVATVPNLVGKKFSDAIVAIDSLGLMLGSVERLPGSRGQARESVISIDPSVGSKLPLGTTVNFVIVD